MIFTFSAALSIFSSVRIIWQQLIYSHLSPSIAISPRYSPHVKCGIGHWLGGIKMSNEMKVMANTKHIAKGRVWCVRYCPAHYRALLIILDITTHPSDAIWWKETIVQLIYLPEVFLKSPEKNETIFPTEVMFLSCLVWIGMTSQKPNRWLTRWNVSGEDDRGTQKWREISAQITETITGPVN